MYNYTYTRDVVDNAFNIDNPKRVDSEGNPILLFDEVLSSSLKSKRLVKIDCNGYDCVVTFEEELTAAEKELLDTIVYNHKNNI